MSVCDYYSGGMGLGGNTMFGKIIKFVPPEKPHRCEPPELHNWNGSKLRFGVGTIWECKCGGRFEVGHRNNFEMIWGFTPEWLQIKGETK